MKILAIETSCDETSIAIIEKVDILADISDLKEKSIYKVLAHNTISQINIHAQYGGVYPTLARREHEKNLIPLLHKSLSDAHLLIENKVEKDLEVFKNDVAELFVRYEILRENFQDFFIKYSMQNIDAIAVTSGPGLPPALWVGVNFAKALSKIISNTPIYPINHMEGHIIGGVAKVIPKDNVYFLKPSLNATLEHSDFQKNILSSEIESSHFIKIDAIKYPALSFLISGGHTEIVISSKENDYRKIGQTLDDAVGESYDKVARMLGLEYPGGPKVAMIASEYRKDNIAKKYETKFPRPMLHSNDLNFSFSGLKTHILYFLRDYRIANNIKNDENLPLPLISEICFEFEESVKEVFIKKLENAIDRENIATLIVGGGVASNDYLNNAFRELAQKLDIDIYISSKDLSTDNALMIALTAAKHIECKINPDSSFFAKGSLSFS
jgi:N6-L-threonylcarbamoyladenine synthase